MLAGVSLSAGVRCSASVALYISECLVSYGHVYALNKEGKERMTVEVSPQRLATTMIGDDLATILAMVVDGRFNCCNGP